MNIIWQQLEVIIVLILLQNSLDLENCVCVCVLEACKIVISSKIFHSG